MAAFVSVPPSSCRHCSSCKPIRTTVVKERGEKTEWEREWETKMFWETLAAFVSVPLPSSCRHCSSLSNTHPHKHISGQGGMGRKCNGKEKCFGKPNVKCRRKNRKQRKIQKERKQFPKEQISHFYFCKFYCCSLHITDRPISRSIAVDR